MNKNENINKIKVLYFSENKQRVIDLIADMATDIDREEMENESPSSGCFNVVVVIDQNNCLLDYKVFDPYHNLFPGYTNHNGWSNWECGYFDSVMADFIEGYQPTESDLELINEIDDY